MTKKLVLRRGAAMKPRKPTRKKPSTKRPSGSGALAPSPAPSDQQDFAEVVEIIQAARERTLSAANASLVDLYWRIGESISGRIESDAWGRGTVAHLAAYIQQRHPGLHGFSSSNLWRMRQFFETYRAEGNSRNAVRELSWTHNLAILSRCKRPDEREFYIRMALRERWSRRDLERQLSTALFERVVMNPPKASAALKALEREPDPVFRDSYLVEFLDLPDGHVEADLHAGLVRNLRRFLAELGRDFCFVGEEVKLQVGGKDFALDLLFFHRELSCLVAIELKVEEFEPAHVGQMQFYLEALDRDVRKPKEGPSIGMLLCAGKNDEVVEYALSRSLSPALVAEYQTRLPDKKLLRAKLHELYALNESAAREKSR